MTNIICFKAFQINYKIFYCCLAGNEHGYLLPGYTIYDLVLNLDSNESNFMNIGHKFMQWTLSKHGEMLLNIEWISVCYKWESKYESKFLHKLPIENRKEMTNFQCFGLILWGWGY